MIRVVLPAHLRHLAQVEGEVLVDVNGAPTLEAVLDAVEAEHPVLRGTIRDQATGKRRAFIRYFAAGSDISHDSPDLPLPGEVTTGRQPFSVIGAISGG